MSLHRFAIACVVFVLALSTEIHAEGIYLIPGEFGWRRTLPLEVLFTCRFYPADRDGRITGEPILDSDVVADLGLSRDAAQKIEQLHNQILAEYDAERHKVPKEDLNKEPDRDLFFTVRNRHRKEFDGLLTPQQQERLDQIHLQTPRQITDALSDSGVANAVGLTEAQRSQIHQLHWEVSHAEHLESGEKATGDYAGPSAKSLYDACPGKIMKLLSDEQRQTFEKLRGAPFVRAQRESAQTESGPLKRLPGARMLAQNCWKASFSPDGNRVVVGKMPESSGLRIVEVATGAARDLLPYGKDPAWSPGDGRLIAFEHHGDEGDEVWIVEVGGANPRKLALGGFPSWSPDAKSVFFQSREHNRLQVIAVDAKGGDATDVMEMAFWYPSVSPDGRQVTYRSGNQIIIADLKTGNAVKAFPIDVGQGFAAGWSPDGKQIGYGGWGGADPVPFSIVDIAAGSTVRFPNIRGTMPAWSPDGSKMVFDVRTVRDRDVWVVDTKALETLGPAKPNSEQEQVSEVVNKSGGTISGDPGKIAEGINRTASPWVAGNSEVPSSSEVIDNVSLTEDQTKAVIRIIEAHGKVKRELEAEILTATTAMNEAYARNDRDAREDAAAAFANALANMHARMRENTTKLHEALDNVLTPEQRDSLQEYYASNRIKCLADPVQLTDEQNKKLKAACREAVKDGGYEALRCKLPEMVQNVLTPEQKAAMFKHCAMMGVASMVEGTELTPKQRKQVEALVDSLGKEQDFQWHGAACQQLCERVRSLLTEEQKRAVKSAQGGK